jgi:hypothetical protein
MVVRPYRFRLSRCDLLHRTGSPHVRAPRMLERPLRQPCQAADPRDWPPVRRAGSGVVDWLRRDLLPPERGFQIVRPFANCPGSQDVRNQQTAHVIPCYANNQSSPPCFCNFFPARSREGRRVPSHARPVGSPVSRRAPVPASPRGSGGSRAACGRAPVLLPRRRTAVESPCSSAVCTSLGSHSGKQLVAQASDRLGLPSGIDDYDQSGRLRNAFHGFLDSSSSRLEGRVLRRACFPLNCFLFFQEESGTRTVKPRISRLRSASTTRVGTTSSLGPAIPAGGILEEQRA